LNIGESFVEVNEDDAKDFVDRQRNKVEQQKKGFIEKYEKNKKRLDDLKIILYAKFEKNINLEED
jgi:chaperonin cofactor prefoldin